MPMLFADLRYGFRQLRLNPGFTALAVVTLALGIGANTALFSVVRNVLLRPLPYRDPARLARVWMDNRRLQMREDWASYLNYEDYTGDSPCSPALVCSCDRLARSVAWTRAFAPPTC